MRPTTLSTYKGQEKITKNLARFIQAAKERKKPLDHVLIFGAAGTGKTTLAEVIANELEVEFTPIMASTISTKRKLFELFCDCPENAVLFFDEIHEIGGIESSLYMPLEDGLIEGEPAYANVGTTKNLRIRPCTIIGATTMPGLLSKPLRDRFPIQFEIEAYKEEHLEQIIINTIGWEYGWTIGNRAVKCVVGASRGTPRIAVNLTRRLVDLFHDDKEKFLKEELAKEGLERLGIDNETFLSETDKKVLLTIKDVFNGGPVGVGVLANTLGMNKETYENMHEPFLMNQGYLKRGGRGRELTAKGYALFGERDELKVVG